MLVETLASHLFQPRIEYPRRILSERLHQRRTYRCQGALDEASSAVSLAPLIEWTVRDASIVVTEMLTVGRDEELETLVRNARALRDELLDPGRGGGKAGA